MESSIGKITLSALLCAGIFSLTSCGGKSNDGQKSNKTPPSVNGAGQTPAHSDNALGAPPLQGVFSLIDGTRGDLSKMSTEKPTVVYFASDT